MSQYYLFRFNQAKEDRVRRNADRYGIEVIAPKVSEWRTGKRGTKPKPKWVPAFHSYLVLGFEIEQLGIVLTKLHRSVRPVLMTCPDGRLALGRVTSSEVERIQSGRQFREVSAPPKTTPGIVLERDDLVRIIGGVAIGFEAHVIDADENTRQAKVEIDGWSAKLTVSYDLLERAA